MSERVARLVPCSGGISLSRRIQYPHHAQGNENNMAPATKIAVGVLPGPHVYRKSIERNRLPSTTMATLTIDRRETVSSLKMIGAVGIRVVEGLPVGGSGSWMVTSPAALCGIFISFLHLGHGPVRPAN